VEASLVVYFRARLAPHVDEVKTRNKPPRFGLLAPVFVSLQDLGALVGFPEADWPAAPAKNSFQE
jgi:hypothetical protein